MKNTLRTPAAGVKGLNLNVIMQPHPTPDFQDVQRGKENATGPGFFNRHKGKKRDAKKLQTKRAAAAKWRLLSESSFHQQTLYPPQYVCPHPHQGPCLPGTHEPSRSTGPMWGSLQQLLRSGQFCHTWPHTQGSFSGSFITSHTWGLSFLQPHYTELHVLSTPTPEQFSELNCHSINLKVYHFQSTNT